ncbi:hypothetical protein B0H13DRAFT_2577384, partial [Mycena leptocephala]
VIRAAHHPVHGDGRTFSVARRLWAVTIGHLPEYFNLRRYGTAGKMAMHRSKTGSRQMLQTMPTNKSLGRSKIANDQGCYSRNSSLADPETRWAEVGFKLWSSLSILMGCKSSDQHRAGARPDRARTQHLVLGFSLAKISVIWRDLQFEMRLLANTGLWAKLFLEGRHPKAPHGNVPLKVSVSEILGVRGLDRKYLGGWAIARDAEGKHSSHIPSRGNEAYSLYGHGHLDDPGSGSGTTYIASDMTIVKKKIINPLVQSVAVSSALGVGRKSETPTEMIRKHAAQTCRSSFYPNWVFQNKGQKVVVGAADRQNWKIFSRDIIPGLGQGSACTLTQQKH